MRRAALLLGLAACGDPPPPAAPEPTPEEALAKAEALAAPAASPGAAVAPSPAPPPKDGVEAPDLVFVWHEIGPLYQSFFTHQEVITALQADLHGWVQGPVNIHIYYDQQRFVGDIRLQLLPGTLVRPVTISGTDVALGELAPITTALATYRSAVSGRFDVRVESFRIGIESFQGPRHCLFTAAGAPPPDGKLVSPCVTLNSQARCGEPQAGGSVRFGAALAKDVQECLEPRG